MESIAVRDTQLPEQPIRELSPKEQEFHIWPSDAGTILGLNPYQTPLELWAIKTGRMERPDLSAIEAVRWGTILEPVIAKEFAEREGVKIRRVNRTLVHPDFPWWRGRIDYQILNQPDRSLLECKNCSEYTRQRWGDDETDIVPDFYAVQVRSYFPLDNGFDRARFAAFIGGNKLRRYTLERWLDVEEIITRRFLEFRQLLIEDRVPPPMSVADIEFLWPQHSDDVIEATDEILVDISRLQEINGKLKELEDAKTEISDRVKMFARDKGYIATPPDPETNDRAPLATYKTTNGTRLDQKSLKQEKPEVYNRYSRDYSFRALRVR